MYYTNGKLVLIEHDLIDRWRVTNLINTYVYIYSLQESYLKKKLIKKIYLWNIASGA